MDKRTAIVLGVIASFLPLPSMAALATYGFDYTITSVFSSNADNAFDGGVVYHGTISWDVTPQVSDSSFAVANLRNGCLASTNGVCPTPTGNDNIVMAFAVETPYGLVSSDPNWMSYTELSRGNVVNGPGAQSSFYGRQTLTETNGILDGDFDFTYTNLGRDLSVTTTSDSPFAAVDDLTEFANQGSGLYSRFYLGMFQNVQRCSIQNPSCENGPANYYREIYGEVVPGSVLATPQVPLPAAAWLLLSGLGGVAALARRRGLGVGAESAAS